jgi:hypothetical protein
MKTRKYKPTSKPTPSAANYAVFATRTGSYGETEHSQVGRNYVDPLAAGLAAIKLYLHGGKDVSFLNLSTGLRVDARVLLQDPYTVTKSH